VLNAYGPFIGTGVKPTLVQNQFGGAFGGPIKHDKVFFFTDYEGLRHVDHSLITAVLPTPAQASGTFTDANGNPITLVNPITGSAYPDGKIPVANQSPFAQKILSLLPAPNTVASAGAITTSMRPRTPLLTTRGIYGSTCFPLYVRMALCATAGAQ
jgi:hypothetical protein